MTRGRHLGDAELLALALRERARVPARAVTHLAGCARCAADLHDVTLLRETAGDATPEPSAGVLARAWALLPPRAPRMAARSQFVLARRIRSSDDVPPAAASGLRGPTAAVHALWHTADAEVDVRIEPPGLGSAGALLGQVFPRTAHVPRTPGAVWLIERGRGARWAPLGAAGDFVLPAPARRHWTLMVEWGALRMRLEHP